MRLSEKWRNHNNNNINRKQSNNYSDNPLTEVKTSKSCTSRVGSLRILTLQAVCNLN